MLALCTAACVLVACLQPLEARPQLGRPPRDRHMGARPPHDRPRDRDGDTGGHFDRLRAPHPSDADRDFQPGPPQLPSWLRPPHPSDADRDYLPGPPQLPSGGDPAVACKGKPCQVKRTSDGEVLFSEPCWLQDSRCEDQTPVSGRCMGKQDDVELFYCTEKPTPAIEAACEISSSIVGGTVQWTAAQLAKNRTCDLDNPIFLSRDPTVVQVAVAYYLPHDGSDGHDSWMGPWDHHDMDNGTENGQVDPHSCFPNGSGILGPNDPDWDFDWDQHDQTPDWGWDRDGTDQDRDQDRDRDHDWDWPNWWDQWGPDRDRDHDREGGDYDPDQGRPMTTTPYPDLDQDQGREDVDRVEGGADGADRDITTPAPAVERLEQGCAKQDANWCPGQSDWSCTDSYTRDSCCSKCAAARSRLYAPAGCEYGDKWVDWCSGGHVDCNVYSTECCYTCRDRLP